MSEGLESLGQRLRAAREQKGLSAQKAADALHLDGWVVEGLESGDYGRLGPSVYVKGHLKRYAALLGLPAAELLEPDGAQPQMEVALSRPASMRLRTSAPAGRELRWVPMAAFAAAAVVIAGVLWWRPWHPRVAPSAATAALSKQSPRAGSTDGESPARGTEAAPVAGAADAWTAGGVAANGAAAAGGGAVAAGGGIAAGGAGSAASPSGASVTRSNSDPNAGLGRARLRLRFSGDSWVDVHDALGQRLFAGNGRANSVKTIAGAGPLRVYLKSASGVQLEINSHAVAIGSEFMVGDVARFEAGADGVLRRDTHVPPAPSGATAPRPRG